MEGPKLLDLDTEKPNMQNDENIETKTTIKPINVAHLYL